MIRSAFLTLYARQQATIQRKGLNTMISFHDITKQFPDQSTAVEQFNLTINKGEFFVLIGPSGCGKTTTLKMINRLIEPTSGHVTIEDKDITDWNRQELRWNIGYVLQQIALFPTMTIAENIAVVPEMRKWKKAAVSERVDELLNMVGLDPETYRDRRPSELSGGQQQRIGVVRALAGNPDIILMDEPFSALDPISREQLQKDIRQLQADIQKTIVFVTHDIDEALALGDRICLMKEGSIVQVGSREELVNEPADDFVKNFIGDRRDPWDTRVKEVMNPNSHLLASTQDVSDYPLYPAPLYIFKDDRTYVGRQAEEGIVSNDPAIHPEDTLKHALKSFDDTELEALPVLTGTRIEGVLSYRDIVQFMKKAQLEEEGEPA